MFYCDFWNNFTDVKKRRASCPSSVCSLISKAYGLVLHLGLCLGKWPRLSQLQSWEVSDSSRGRVPEVTSPEMTAGDGVNGYEQ